MQFNAWITPWRDKSDVTLNNGTISIEHRKSFIYAREVKCSSYGGKFFILIHTLSRSFDSLDGNKLTRTRHYASLLLSLIYRSLKRAGSKLNRARMEYRVFFHNRTKKRSVLDVRVYR